MGSNSAIEVRNVSKSFKMESSDRSRVGLFKKIHNSVENKVLDNISVDIKKGDVVGIIGRNGSGKSTFLSLLARIMDPDEGVIERFGKIASILELGMGFHPDMSGRENIYLKGELYGFSKKEMDDRLDKIISYSGIGDYIDYPVRTYSSGMSGRLAFSIMIHVEADIMLVDEVLSVGDASFEAKAREHFKKVATSGKTVVIVSHSISLIESMCTRALWFENGKLYRDGPAKVVCAEYQNVMSESSEVIVDLATAGVSDSQYKLAIMYRDGRIFEQNSDLFNYWIEQAASQGHVKAQVEYADLLMRKGNVEEAILYYQSAANRGDSDAKLKYASIANINDPHIDSLLGIFKQLAIRGDALSEYRYADLLLKVAWDHTDKSFAYDMFLKSAEHGYVNAMHQVAVMCRDGIGVSRDLSKMEYYFELAATQGYVPSMVILSDLYFQGRLLPRDEYKSFKWALSAAELGHAGCMYLVAGKYHDGSGTDVDMDQSDYWYSRFRHANLFWHYYWATDAIKTTSVTSDVCLSEMCSYAAINLNPIALSNYIQSLFIEGKSTDEAILLLEKQANSGNLDAIRKMAEVNYDGIFVKRDYVCALEWYKKASKLNDSRSEFRIAEMYRDGKGVSVDFVSSAEWFIRAAEHGHVAALDNIISLYASGELTDCQYLSKAYGMLEKYAEHGVLDAIKRLAHNYYMGIGVKRDLKSALRWYTLAAKLGDISSRSKVAEMYRDGKGVEKSLDDAIYWYSFKDLPK